LHFRHKEQYRFNADIQDHVASVASQLEKLAQPGKEEPIVEKVIKELKEGPSFLAENIHFTDQAENSWDTVAEYMGYSFVDDDKDDRKMDSLDRSAGNSEGQPPRHRKGRGSQVAIEIMGIHRRDSRSMGHHRGAMYQELEFQGYDPPSNLIPYGK